MSPLLSTALKLARVPADVVELVQLLVRLAPDLRSAVTSLVRAFDSGDDEAQRRAYEAARRAAFIARQR